MPDIEYPIMGKYQNEEKEEIDSADTKEEAEYLLKEYQLAFGSGWKIWIGKKRRCHAPD